MPAYVTARAPAKVNLHLGVGPLRPDGYHELVTVFQALSLADHVTVAEASRSTVHVTGEGAAEVPATSANLAAIAVKRLAKRLGVTSKVALTIHKEIPVAGGMAGGSADAAAALVAANALWGTGVERDVLAEVAASVGSDVPFGLHGGTALGTGRGERLVPVLGRPATYHWVLALSGHGLSTPEVFAALDRRRPDPTRAVATPAGPVLAALRTGNASTLAAALANDLQSAALTLRPGLRRVLAAGHEMGALGSIVSGSGPTVALLCRDAEHAGDVAAGMSGLDVCRTVRVASGPVPGARVVDQGTARAGNG